MSSENRFYGWAKMYDLYRPSLPNKIVEFINDIVGKDNVVVDIGCGTGLSTIALSSCANKIIGIDCNKEMLDVAETKRKANVNFIHTNAEHTGLDTCSVDIVFCCQSFHWLKTDKAMSEIHRILKNDGFLILIDYNWPPRFTTRMNLLINKLLRWSRRYDFIQFKDKNVKHKHYKQLLKSDLFTPYCKKTIFDICEFTAESLMHSLSAHGNVMFALKNKKFKDYYNKTSRNFHKKYNDKKIIGKISYNIIIVKKTHNGGRKG